MDHSFPSQLVMRALYRFSIDRPRTQVSLCEVAAANAERALSEEAVDIAITRRVPYGLYGYPLIEVEYVAVAHPEHCLFRMGRTLETSDLAHQAEVKIGGARDGVSIADIEQPTISQWRVGSTDSALQALLQGFCYAWLPKFQVRQWLDQGRLKLLPIAERSAYKLCFYLMAGRPRVQDTSAERLASILRSTASSEWGDNNGILLAHQ